MSNDIVLNVENLGIVYNLDVKKNWTLRDTFVQLAQHPLEVLSPAKDRLIVANGVNLTLRKGERLGILGVNGAGKTSICRCFAGLYRPNKGKVVVNGSVRAIFNTAVVIQPELTGRENAELFAEFMYPEFPNKKALVEEALDFSELKHFVDVPYKNYSNGMQTRLQLSLISALPSELLILDEVFDGADSFFKKKIADRVMNMIRESGAVIFVSHSADQLMKVCTRIVVYHNANIAFDGVPEEAIKFYESLQPQS